VVAVLVAVVEAVDQATLPAGNLGMVIEHFRGSPHADLIAGLAGQIEAEAGDEGEQEAVFQDAVARLRQRALQLEIDVLTARARASGLDAAGRQALADLLARKKVL